VTTCDDLTVFADGELADAPERAQAFRGHLSNCAACQRDLRAHLELIARLTQLAQLEEPTPVRSILDSDGAGPSERLITAGLAGGRPVQAANEGDDETKLVSWHDADGQIRVAEVPRDAVCLEVGGWCAICEATERTQRLLCTGRILAIGLSYLVCTSGLHPVPSLVVLLRDASRGDVDVVDTRGKLAW